MMKVNWNRIEFLLGNFAMSGARLTSTNTFQLHFPSRTNRTYGVFRSTNWLDWLPVFTNVAGTGAEVWATDTNTLSVDTVLYRVRINP
jgi:hypothetical protein